MQPSDSAVFPKNVVSRRRTRVASSKSPGSVKAVSALGFVVAGMSLLSCLTLPVPLAVAVAAVGVVFTCASIGIVNRSQVAWYVLVVLWSLALVNNVLGLVMMAAAGHPGPAVVMRTVASVVVLICLFSSEARKHCRVSREEESRVGERQEDPVPLVRCLECRHEFTQQARCPECDHSRFIRAT